MRSILFVPAREKMLQKINGFKADGYILDLEDSISETSKDVALTDLCAYLSTTNSNERMYVRLDNTLLDSQIKALNKLNFKGYVIPKFEHPENYSKYLPIIQDKAVIALIETPLGILNSTIIAKCEWIDALAFGAEDFSASIGMVNNHENLLQARSMLLMAGKANKKPVYDTPSFILDNGDALKAEVQYSVDMGFDGKLAINPKQITIINSVYEQIDVEAIQNIITMYESNDAAVQVINGKVYEKMHIAHMKKILKEKYSL